MPVKNKILPVTISGLIHQQSIKFIKLNKKVSNDYDVETLHNLRVSSRRLIEYLNISQKIFLTEDFTKKYKLLKKIIKISNNKRNIDVFLQYLQGKIKNNFSNKNREEVLYIFNVFKKKQNKLQRNILKKLKYLKLKKLQKFLEDIEEHLKELSVRDKKQKNIKIYLNQLLKNYGEKILSLKELALKEEDLQSLHKQRIALKKYRYVFEIKEHLLNLSQKEKYNLIKSLQDTIGNIHNQDVFKAMLEKEREKLQKKNKDKDLISNLQFFINFLLQERNFLFKKYSHKVTKENILEKIVVLE